MEIVILALLLLLLPIDKMIKEGMKRLEKKQAQARAEMSISPRSQHLHGNHSLENGSSFSSERNTFVYILKEEIYYHNSSDENK